MSLFEAIGHRLKGERERLQLGQEAMAEAIAAAGARGGTRQSQRLYEVGERLPDAGYLAAAHGMGVDVLYVLTGQRLQPMHTIGMQSNGVVGLQWPIGAAVMAAEEAAPWRVNGAPPVRPDTTHMGGGATRMGSTVTPVAPTALGASALLPVTGARAVRPLVLSLPLGERGGHNQQVDYQVIPRHIRPAAAGAGSMRADDNDTIDAVGEMAMSFDWMRRNMGPTEGPLTSIQVRGDSMATTLLDGDTIIIDQGCGQIDVDGIYVIDVHGRRLVKRVQMLYDGGMVLISDNAAYERQSVPRDAARNISVVGRMVWPRVR